MGCIQRSGDTQRQELGCVPRDLQGPVPAVCRGLSPSPGEGPGLQATPPPSKGRRRRAHAPPSPPAPMVQLRGVGEGGGWRAARGHWLPRRDPRWAAVPHWLVPSIRRTVSDRDTPHLRPASCPHPRGSGCWSPGAGRGPRRLLGLWRPFGNLTHPLSASPELAGSRELARGSQSFRGSRGGAAVAGCEEGLAEAPARELWPRLGWV